MLSNGLVFSAAIEGVPRTAGTNVKSVECSGLPRVGTDAAS
jgi:hypothetical protein